MLKRAAAGAPRSALIHDTAVRLVSLVAIAGAVWGAAACATLASDPNVPASIEAKPLAFPSIAVGDSLRDTLGVAQPIQVVLRDLSGAVLPDLPVRFLYVQYARDSAIEVDSLTGYVRARKRPTGTAEIAARFGSVIQILIPIKVSVEPDSLQLTNAPEIRRYFPDTGAVARDSNSAAIDIKLQYDSAGALFNTADWLVRYTVVYPENLTNDTTAAAFMIGVENARPSQLDTTSSTGVASRRVRVRYAQFPEAPAERDTVVVEVLVVKRGKPIRDSALYVKIPVVPRGASAIRSLGTP